VPRVTGLGETFCEMFARQPGIPWTLHVFNGMWIDAQLARVMDCQTFRPILICSTGELQP